MFHGNDWYVSEKYVTVTNKHYYYFFNIHLVYLQVPCTVVATLIYYLFMVAFAWMAVEGLHLYFLTFVVWNAARRRIKYYMMCCWGRAPYAWTVAAPGGGGGGTFAPPNYWFCPSLSPLHTQISSYTIWCAFPPPNISPPPPPPIWKSWCRHWLWRKYTERQNKLITSSGRRSLKSTASKLIILGHK